MAIPRGRKDDTPENVPDERTRHVEYGERVYAEFLRYRQHVAQIHADAEARLAAAEHRFAVRVEAIVSQHTPVISGAPPLQNGEMVSPE